MGKETRAKEFCVYFVSQGKTSVIHNDTGKRMNLMFYSAYIVIIWNLSGHYKLQNCLALKESEWQNMKLLLESIWKLKVVQNITTRLLTDTLN